MRLAKIKDLRKEAERREMGGIKKYHPRLVHEPDGPSIPLVILSEMSGYMSVLERRGTVTGPNIGNAYGCLSAFEDTFTGEPAHTCFGDNDR